MPTRPMVDLLDEVTELNDPDATIRGLSDDEIEGAEHTRLRTREALEDLQRKREMHTIEMLKRHVLEEIDLCLRQARKAKVTHSLDIPLSMFTPEYALDCKLTFKLTAQLAKE